MCLASRTGGRKGALWGAQAPRVARARLPSACGRPKAYRKRMLFKKTRVTITQPPHSTQKKRAP